ncbi:MAG: RHS repeat protein, partial [Akkermansia sp.]|nr:RHS repeat protein [Akkermansia sp.]
MQLEIDRPYADTLHFHKRLQGDEWKHIDNVLLWLPETDADKVRLFTLPAGTYYISARLSNKSMNYIYDNRTLFRYAIHSLSSFSPVRYLPDASIIGMLNCEKYFDGDADYQPSASILSSNDDICRTQVFPVLTAEGKTALKYDGPWGWTCSRNADAITITPTKGMSLTFAVDETDSSLARPQGETRKRDFRVQLQNTDGSTCTTGEPARIMLTDATGLSLIFDAATGSVIATKSPEGKVHEKSVRDTQITEIIENGLLKSVVSATEGTLITTEQPDGSILMEYFLPTNITVNDNGSIITSGLPYKTDIYKIDIVDGVQTTTVRHRQQNLDEFITTRIENGESVIITKGEGAEAIVRTFTTSYPTNGIMQRIESVQRVADELPASCSCTTMQYTEGGWLLLERKEGFGSELEQTEQFFYNEQFRLSRSFRHNGHYTLYSYDTEGRVTEVTSPKADGMKSITRTTYANGRFFDNRPATVTEFNVNANGTEVLFR